MTTARTTPARGTLDLLEEARALREDRDRLLGLVSDQEERIRVLERDRRIDRDGLAIHAAGLRCLAAAAPGGVAAMRRAVANHARAIGGWKERRRAILGGAEDTHADDVAESLAVLTTGTGA